MADPSRLASTSSVMSLTSPSSPRMPFEVADDQVRLADFVERDRVLHRQTICEVSSASGSWQRNQIRKQPHSARHGKRQLAIPRQRAINTPEYDASYGPFPYSMGSNPEEVSEETRRLRSSIRPKPSSACRIRSRRRISAIGSSSAGPNSSLRGTRAGSRSSKRTTPVRIRRKALGWWPVTGRAITLSEVIRRRLEAPVNSEKGTVWKTNHLGLVYTANGSFDGEGSVRLWIEGYAIASDKSANLTRTIAIAVQTNPFAVQRNRT